MGHSRAVWEEGAGLTPRSLPRGPHGTSTVTMADNITIISSRYLLLLLVFQKPTALSSRCQEGTVG